MSVTLSRFLKAKFVERGVSIEDAAKALAIDRSTLYRKLADDDCKDLSIGDLKRIIDFLNIDARQVVNFF